MWRFWSVLSLQNQNHASRFCEARGRPVLNEAKESQPLVEARVTNVNSYREALAAASDSYNLLCHFVPAASSCLAKADV